MIKKGLAAVLTICLLIALTGCNKGVSPQTPTPSPTPNTNSNSKETETQKGSEVIYKPQVEVPVDLEVVKNNQQQADGGHSPWQLDPLQVAQTFVSLQISPQGVTGEFPVKEEEVTVLEKTAAEVIAEIKSDKTGTTKVYMKKLAKQDDSGIWTVVGFDADEARYPSISGIHLGDSKDKVIEILGKDYKETVFEEAEHYPETFANWEYAEGYVISIGQKSNTVLQIMATSPRTVTNLAAKIGDGAQKILPLYRAKYTEPVSIHGPKLLGVFKVENGQAMILDFDKEDGLVNPPDEEIKPDAVLQRMILTYPAYLDDSF